MEVPREHRRPVSSCGGLALLVSSSEGAQVEAHTTLSPDTSPRHSPRQGAFPDHGVAEPPSLIHLQGTAYSVLYRSWWQTCLTVPKEFQLNFSAATMEMKCFNKQK